MLNRLGEAGLGLLTTDIIVAELAAPNPKELTVIGVRVSSLEPAQVVRLLEVRSLYPAPSLADLSALVLAESLDAQLLTGDKHLREAALDIRIEAHGTIWIFERLVALGSMTEQEVKAAHGEMLSKGRRLPPLL